MSALSIKIGFLSGSNSDDKHQQKCTELTLRSGDEIEGSLCLKDDVMGLKMEHC